MGFNKDDIKIVKVDDETTVVRFLAPVKIGTKSFGVGLFFENGVIWSIDLKVADPSINEWDYKEMLAQHGE
ncbi:hypothetical protein COJ42_24930 [Bacillus cereus]|nr:hypothetical protein CN464_27480 [Bacillus cereus]PFM28186.1 hypothetical protein COJ42_24930 [Bacillus cereus]PFP85447.1 hypothetical protein COK02_24700 [Bacillus cereus]